MSVRIVVSGVERETSAQVGTWVATETVSVVAMPPTLYRETARGSSLRRRSGARTTPSTGRRGLPPEGSIDCPRRTGQGVRRWQHNEARRDVHDASDHCTVQDWDDVTSLPPCDASDAVLCPRARIAFRWVQGLIELRQSSVAECLPELLPTGVLALEIGQRHQN